MLLKTISRVYVKNLPVWPLKLAKRFIFMLFRGNFRYVLVSLFCFSLIVYSRFQQSNVDVLLAEPVFEESPHLKIPKVVPEVMVRNIREYNEVKKKETVQKSIKSCSDLPSILVGNLTINPNITPSYKDVQGLVGKYLIKGGCFTPTKCKPKQKVAIIIPFKDREAHLKTLLYYLHPILIRQRSLYCIYVAEQFDNGLFNKAMIMNAAFAEVMKLNSYDCIIFHDVDMIPENDKNLYECGTQPRHLSPAIDKFKYEPHYGTDFGGVTAITPEQYRKANGHSNEYWGWGGEDNDMEFRIKYNGMKIIPSPLNIGRYKMIVHYHPWKFRPGEFPYFLNKTAKARAKTDGLNDLSYRLIKKIQTLTYTKLMIDIRRINVTDITMYIDGKKAMKVDLHQAECRYMAYPNKYLDYKMKLSDYKEALPYLSIAPEATEFIPKEIEAKIRSKPPKERHSSNLNSYEEAVKVCELLQPECQGIQQEPNYKFSLKRGGIPRNLAILKEPNIRSEDKSKQSTNKDESYYFPSQTAYIRYCPGSSGSIQKHEPIIPVNLQLNRSKAQHFYSFEIHFSVLLQPTKYIYYADAKMLEGHEKIHDNMYTFNWPGNGRTPNFNLPNAPRSFIFTTSNFSFPNIPGAYGIESKIVSRQLHPYFQWNWWIEISSKDLVKDVQVREAYRKELIKARTRNIAEEKRQLKLRSQKRKEYLFEKEMARIKGQPFEINPDFEFERNIPENVAAKFKTSNDLPQLEYYSDYHKTIAAAVTVKPKLLRKKSFHLHLPEKLKKKS